MRQTSGGGGSELSGERIPAGFALNHSTAVCLPVVSDGQKLVWVRSAQIDLQVGGVAELQKAFDSFPYLTEKQTAALAQSCSLHPDQVRVWFMLQRLRYGISWDYKDIPDVWRKIQPNHKKGKQQSRMEKETNMDRRPAGQKKEGDESDGKKEGKVREEQSGNQRRVMGQNVKSNEQWKRKRRQEPVKKVKKRKGIRAACNLLQSVFPSISNCHTIAEKREPEGDAGLEGNVRDLNHSAVIHDADKPEELSEDNHPDVAQGLCAPKQESEVRRSSQMAMLKVAFCHCQYPNRDDYNQLASVSGVPRRALTKWFGDMRYYVKKRRPHWMSQEQHSKALANIQYQQRLQELAQGGPQDCARED